MEDGFPITEPCYMTWRDIRDAIGQMDDEELDKAAIVSDADGAAYYHVGSMSYDEEDPSDSTWLNLTDPC